MGVVLLYAYRIEDDLQQSDNRISLFLAHHTDGFATEMVAG
jgi:hypothetical protein